jgi:hypothetical protein
MIHFDNAELRNLRLWNGNHAECYVGLLFLVETDKFRKVHAVKVIAGQEKNHVAGIGEIGKVLSNRIGGTLIPSLAVNGLRSRENRNKTARKRIEPVCLKDVAMQRFRGKLGKNPNGADAVVKAVADRDVDKSEFAAYRHCGFRARLRKRVQPGSLATGQYD